MIGEAFKVAHTSNDKPRKNSGERSLALTDLQKMNQELKAENDSLRKKVVELEWRLQEKSVLGSDLSWRGEQFLTLPSSTQASADTLLYFDEAAFTESFSMDDKETLLDISI
nr:PREDICTED: uncharacterized protein LOC106702449 [Latimeria chalumnae]|eukprot:XP_014340303.1 PREDICTED: uncharacterized protein LOC106702449 [Latimeria chalumnae]